jgi:hypothetical protein
LNLKVMFFSTATCTGIFNSAVERWYPERHGTMVDHIQ